MREDCKHYQVRSYPSGDMARFCALGLAPEAPWRCPEGCPRYEKKRVRDHVKSGAQHERPVPPEPEPTAGVAEVLGSAAEIISAAVPEILAEQERRRKVDARRPWWQRLRKAAPWRRS